MAAEALLSVTLERVFKLVFSKSGYVYDFIKRKKINESLLWELETKLRSANSVMDDAEAKQLQNPKVREWLVDLKATMCDAEDLVDEIDAEALRWERNSRLKKVIKSIPAEFKKHGCEFKAKEIISRLDIILKQKDDLGLKGGVQNLTSTRTPDTSLVDESGVYGRDDDKNVIIELLLSDEVSNNKVSVIPIVGMGGIGKTTLAQLIYNDDGVKNHFQIKAWVCVSDDFDILRITKAIFKEVTSQACDASTELNKVQVELQQALKGNKFLVVLDDVWNEKNMEWDKLSKPFSSGARGSKIIVTTRNGHVADIMRTVQSHKLEVISEDDCWSLFVKHAFVNIEQGAHSELEKIGRQIVEKCKGLPLAVKALGSLLRVERNPQEWKNILTSDIWDESLQKKHDILPSLWLSYFYLPPNLKRCFAYCSIFPKDYKFKKEDLILLWMGENLLKPHKYQSLEEVGEEYFNDLLSRSLFQLAEDGSFTMHDLINDLAMFVSGESCLRLEDANIVSKAAGKTTRRRLSCMTYGLRSIEDLKDSCNVKILRSLLLTGGIFGWDQDLENHLVQMLESMQYLRVLEVCVYSTSVCGIKVFKSIANLKLLGYLRCDGVKIEEINYSFCNLYNLQTLILRDCGCTKLPDSIGKLKQLRHLDLSGSSITEIPDSICSLKSLRHLDLSGSSIIEIPDSICSLESLRHLDLSKSKIKELPDTVGNFHELRTLKINECGIKSLPNSITMLTNLRQLILDDDYWWGSDFVPMPPQMSKLENLQTMPRMELSKDTGGNIKELGKLQHLQGKVCIGGFENVGNAEDASEANLKDKKGITALLLKWTEDTDDSQVAQEVLDRLQPHTNLNRLQIYNYGGTSFPCWFGYESFSCIKVVVLYNCKNCTKLPALGQLPSLEDLRIGGFDMLERIGNEFYYSSDTAQHASSSITESPFNSLKGLEFRRMAEWKEWSVVELFEGSGGAFSNLEKLKLSNCPKLKWACLPEYLPSLRELEIEYCKNMKDFPAEWRLPSNIQSITIRGCDDLKSFSEEGWPSNLTELVISRCDQLFAAKQWNLGMLSSLTSLQIRCMYEKEVETFPEKEGQLPTSLTSLSLYSMPNLKSLNGKAFQRLTSLSQLMISDCPLLQCLGMLSSLAFLEIYNIEEVETFPEKEGQLPTSLTSLHLSRMRNLKYLNGKAFQRLTSLQQLSIEYCQQLQGLGEEALPSSISQLRISYCPLLEPRCQRETGEDWSKIRHIPHILICESE